MNISSDKLKQIEELIQFGIDQQYLLGTASMYGVLPILYQTLAVQ